MRPMTLATALVAVLASTAAAAAEPVSAEQVAALEARIAQLEQQSQALRAQAEQAIAAAQAARDALVQIRQQQQENALTRVAAASAATAPSGANGNAFNPGISVVLNGTYAHHSLPPERFARDGFPQVGEGGPVEQGLSLGESELSLAANVDDKFLGQLTMAVGSDEGSIAVEEAFIEALSLPGGLSLRAGRFFSNIGYLNSHHTHTDQFTDRPLANQVLLGNQYFDDGLQLRWVAPTDLFLELGGELLRGDAFPAGGAGNGGLGSKTAFVHVGGDIGDEQSWLAGVSTLHTDANHAEDGFSGNADLYIADLTWKWAPKGNFKDGGLTLRSEVFAENRKGWLADPETDAFAQRWNGQRWGAYLQGVYRINRHWETGYRYDRLWSENGLPLTTGFDPKRHTVMLTWLNSEFSLLRLQLSHEKPNSEAVDNAISLQYQINMGAHGAHKF